MVYLFDSFELDEQNFSLTQAGQRVPLEPKCLRVLLLLAQNEGRLLEKNAIIEVVWKDTFVEDGTLTRAIALLRRQLGDDPRNPRFIETVPTLGYRFIVPVETQSRKDRSAAPVETEVDASPLALPDFPAEALPPPVNPHTPADQPTPIEKIPELTRVVVSTHAPRKSKTWALVAAGLLLLAAAASYRFVFHPAQRLTEKDTIVLGDFANSTGDPVFDDTLRQGIMVQLEQSPFLSLVSDERIQGTLALMERPTDARLTPELGRDLCQRVGSAAVLNGSIAQLGSQYVLGLRAVDCRTGDVIDVEQVQASHKEDVLNALSQIARRFRTRIGESLTTVKQYDTPLAEATTPSLDALKAYSAAWRVTAKSGHADDVSLYKRAAEIDPQFAMAYASLGQVYGDLGEFALAAQNIGKAYELRDRASDRERFFITASYEMVVTGDLEKAQEACAAWAQNYPRDVIVHAFLSGIIYPVLGEYERAIDEAKKSVEADPNVAYIYANLALDYQALERSAEERNTLQLAHERKLDTPDYLLARYEMAFLENDTTEMEQIAAQAANVPGAEDEISDLQSFAMAYSGHLKQARAMSEHAVGFAQRAELLERAALMEAGSALREGLFGDADAARRSAATALWLSKGRDTQYGAAFALALAGDSPQAQMLMDDLEKRFPQNTEVKYNYIPALRARLALNHNDAAKAIETLQVALPYELGEPTSSFTGLYGLLYPAYVRGQAYLALHQGTQAAAEFQKILDHPGIVVSDPVGALARLQLARAYAMSGDTAKARATYQSFLNLWKDADPDIPILQQAKAEFAKL